MIKKRWTPEEEIKLKDLVSTNKYSFNTISKLMGRTKESCKAHSHWMGLKNNYLFTKYSVNEKFWETPNPINSYYAGMSSADATIAKEKTYHLGIQRRDESWLRQFKDNVNYTGVIYNSHQERTDSHIVTLSITSRKWIKDLAENFSVIPQKTFRLAPPKMNNNFLELCWLAGMTDGDGTVCLTYRKKEDVNVLMLNYVSCSLEIIEYIKDLIDKNVPIDLTLKQGRTRSIHKIKGTNAYSIGMSGSRAIFLFELLRQLPVPKMIRKWEQPKVLEFIKKRRLDYPEFFQKGDEFINKIISDGKDSISQSPAKSVKPVAITNLN